MKFSAGIKHRGLSGFSYTSYWIHCSGHAGGRKADCHTALSRKGLLQVLWPLFSL